MEEELQRAMEGDADAFVALMDAFSQQMYKTAWSILKNDADVADAMQETIVCCYEKIGTLRNPGFFRTWVIRILINECYQILRKEKRSLEKAEAWGRNCSEGGNETQPYSFQELISYSDEKYHLLLTLYYADEYSVAEIARILNMNKNTVKTRLNRARQQIRRGLDEEDRIFHGEGYQQREPNI